METPILEIEPIVLKFVTPIPSTWLSAIMSTTPDILPVQPDSSTPVYLVHFQPLPTACLNAVTWMTLSVAWVMTAP